MAERKSRTERLRSREQKIMKLLSFAVNNDGVSGHTCETSKLVWIKRRLLQRFLSCNDDCGLERIQATREGKQQFIIENKVEKCSHGNMHPLKARNGKLIPESAFLELCEVLKKE